MFKKDKKSDRPFVVFQVSDRIVQRSILDVLQADSNIKPFFEVSTCFGGIEGRGVKSAIGALQHAMKNGTQYFIRTDIKEFFRCIRKDTVIEKIGSVIPDTEFMGLLAGAVTTELKNVESLGKLADLLPTEGIGVAQGCCLSPLIGNIVLEEFDKAMNGRGIVCLRYIDDFLLLGPKKRHVRRAFDGAQRLLKGYGLQVYDPAIDSGKAEAGKVGRDAISFLGCEIYPNEVYPNKASRDGLVDKIRNRLDESIAEMSDPERIRERRMSVLEALSHVDSVLRAWGNGYAFYNHRVIFNQLDEKVDELLDHYFQRYRIVKGRVKKDVKKASRRILGVHLLQDSRLDPIR